MHSLPREDGEPIEQDHDATAREVVSKQNMPTGRARTQAYTWRAPRGVLPERHGTRQPVYGVQQSRVGTDEIVVSQRCIRYYDGARRQGRGVYEAWPLVHKPVRPPSCLVYRPRAQRSSVNPPCLVYRPRAPARPPPAPRPTDGTWKRMAISICPAAAAPCDAGVTSLVTAWL